MNEELLYDEKNKKKKGRKRGLKNNQPEGLSVDQFEISNQYSNSDNLDVNNTQEMTNLNFMSTEITVAKEVHKRKQRIPISHCQEII